jgi:hypothetical protein
MNKKRKSSLLSITFAGAGCSSTAFLYVQFFISTRHCPKRFENFVANTVLWPLGASNQSQNLSLLKGTFSREKFVK